MVWRDAPGAFVRLITWRTRLNRMQFGVGYMALTFSSAILMQLAMFAIAAALGGIEELFDHTGWVALAFLPMTIVLFGLVVGRAHDIGWPGWPFILLYIVPLAGFILLMDGLGMFGAAPLARLAGMPEGVVFALTFIPALLVNVALIVLASVPGQKAENRYGAAVAPGLWNDLPPTRA